MAKKKKASALSPAALLPLAVSLVGAVLTVLGIFLKWTVYKTESVLGSSKNGLKLSELKDGDGYTFMCIMAYAVLVLAVVSFALAIARIFISEIPAAAGALTGIVAAVCAIVLLIVTIVFCSNNATFSIGSIASGKMVISVGAILSVIGGILSGAAAVLGYKK